MNKQLSRHNWTKPVPFWLPAAICFGPLATMLSTLGGFQFPFWVGFGFTFVGVMLTTSVLYYYHKRLWQVEQLLLRDIFDDIEREKRKQG